MGAAIRSSLQHNQLYKQFGHHPFMENRYLKLFIAGSKQWKVNDKQTYDQQTVKGMKHIIKAESIAFLRNFQ